MTPAHITDASHMFNLTLAGNAMFTLRSARTGDRYTYKVSRAKDNGKSAAMTWFVGLLTGPSNESDYNYIGIIRSRDDDAVPAFRTTAKTRNPGSAPVRGFGWFFRQVTDESKALEQVEFWHAGRCCRCGRTLTDPDSIASGIGPVCAAK